MDNVSFKDRIVERLDQLSGEQQREVWEYIETLQDRPRGEPGYLFLERTKHLHIDPEDLKLMEQAIEEDCERIDDEPDVNFPE